MWPSRPLSDPVLKQRYDEWLRACRGRSAKAVEPVTCPSCQTTIRSAPEQGESWDMYQRRHRAKEDHDHNAGATAQGNQPFPRARMAMVGIGALFTIVIVFALTKPSKVIISNKPPRMNEQETILKTEPLGVEEEEHVHQAVDVQDGVSTSSVQANERETPLRNAPTTNAQQEHLDRPELTKRLMAQALRACAGIPTGNDLRCRPATTDAARRPGQCIGAEPAWAALCQWARCAAGLYDGTEMV